MDDQKEDFDMDTHRMKCKLTEKSCAIMRFRMSSSELVSMSGIPLPLRTGKFVSLTRVWGMLGGAYCGPTCSKAVLPQNQVKHLQRVHNGLEGEDGKVWCEKQPVQGY